MKMVKSLLLGSAAGLVAVAGANAADLPVKAKAVEYVKVCSAYGAGYYYVPGTDTCLKIGGYARADYYVNGVGTFNPAISSATAAAFNNPGVGAAAYPFTTDRTPNYTTRVRGVFDFDARTATDYGILRSYVRGGIEWNSYSGTNNAAGSNLYYERAFIQFAGFTFGYTQSFFDTGIDYMMTTPYAGSNQWNTVIAYTAQFGNGFSASL
ncbi:MAG: porin, partial [Rhizobiales bacterium 32-66-11]